MHCSVKHFIFLLFVTTLLGCSQNQVISSDASERADAPLPPNHELPKSCKQPAPVLDIWKLEPILIKNGTIKENMKKAEKEVLIRQFIEKKNQQYQLCMKGSKSS